MPTYGFKSKKTAVNARDLAEQENPGTANQEIPEVLAFSFLVRAPSAGIPPMSGAGVPTSAICNAVYIDNNGDIQNMINHSKDGNPLTIKVYNTTLEKIQGQSVFTADVVGGKTIAGKPPVDPQKTTSIIRFELTVVLSSEGWGSAKVLDTFGSSIVAVDDIVAVGSTVPMYRTLGIGGIGLAVLSGNDDDVTPTVAQAWHIIHAQLPTDVWILKLKEDLWRDNNATIEWDSAPVMINFNVEPYTQYQNWINDVPSRPTIKNPYFHDGIAGANIEVRLAWDDSDESPIWYVDDTEGKKARLLEADVITETTGTFGIVMTKPYSGINPLETVWTPEGLPLYQYPSTDYQTNGPPSVLLAYDTTNNKYQFVNHIKYVAKWVLGQFTIPADSSGEISVSVGVSSFFDGYNPGSTVTAVFNVPTALGGCEAKTTFGWCTYRPEDQKYQVISTVAGLMGSPFAVDIQVGPATAVFDPASDCSTPLCYTADYQKIQTFGCEPQSPADYTQKQTLCISEELCKFICSCCDVFATSGDTSECKPCEGTCEWDWNIGNQEWDLVDESECVAASNCDCGDQPQTPPVDPNASNTLFTPCERKDPPPPPCGCGTCDFTWDDTLKVWNLTSTDCETLCGCGVPQGVGTFEGEIQVVCCVFDDPPVDCCVECGGDEVTITSYSAELAMAYQITQNGDSVSNGPCSWRVPVHITVFDGDPPHDIDHEYDSTVTITHDDQNLWDVTSPVVTTPNPDPPGGTTQFNTSWDATAPCDENPVDCSLGECNDNQSAGFSYQLTTCPNVLLGNILFAAHPELMDTGCDDCDNARNMMNNWTTEKVQRRINLLVTVLTANLVTASVSPIPPPELLNVWIQDLIDELEV